jgi:hypothetical protein
VGSILVLFFHHVVDPVRDAFCDGARQLVVMVGICVVIAYNLHVRFFAVLVDECKCWQRMQRVSTTDPRLSSAQHARPAAARIQNF